MNWHLKQFAIYLLAVAAVIAFAFGYVVVSEKFGRRTAEALVQLLIALMWLAWSIWFLVQIRRWK